MVHTSECKWDKICVSRQSPRKQRRINGLQLPLHPQQVIGWIAIVVTSAINFTIVVPAQTQPLRDVAWLSFLALYLLHAAAHVTALLLDPAERQLRRLSRFSVPEFDRAVHAHVIENGRCHLCNIHTSSKNTKHCSICNKCVDCFDHHCKWLNHCIGRRNYVPFFLSVTTATLLSAATAVLCLCDIIFYFVSPQLLCYNTTTTLGLNQTNSSENLYQSSGWSFICILGIFGSTTFAISCVLMHLCSFHIYISCLGVSTYDYIVRNAEREEGQLQMNQTHDCSLTPLKWWSTKSQTGNSKHCSVLCGKTNRWHKNKVGNMIETVSNDVYNNGASNLGNLEVPVSPKTIEVRRTINKSTVSDGSTPNITHLMSVIINKVNSKNILQQKSVKKQVDTVDTGLSESGLMTILPLNNVEQNEEHVT